MRPRAFGGGPLAGDQLLKFVYLDEAGSSACEPVSVVAGVIVDGDRQWKRLETRLTEISDSYCPDRKRIFHAKDIFHGTKDFDRESWPLEKRLALLREILGVPMSLEIPVAFGYLNKNDLDVNLKPKDKAMMDHVMTFQMCAFAAENFMRSLAARDEVAILVAEDNADVRQAVKMAHQFMNTPEAFESFPWLRETIPLTRIVDTVHFAGKKEAPLLQLADACAFAISRLASGRAHAEGLFDALAPGIRPGFGETAGWNLLHAR